jgi:hypothetical protein
MPEVAHDSRRLVGTVDLDPGLVTLTSIHRTGALRILAMVPCVALSDRAPAVVFVLLFFIIRV